MSETAIAAPSNKTRNKRHDVHVYVLTRVKVCNVKAPSVELAAAKAESLVLDHLHEILDGPVIHSLDDGAYVDYTEYAEEGPQCFLVDPYQGDEVDYERCRWLDSDYQPIKNR